MSREDGCGSDRVSLHVWMTEGFRRDSNGWNSTKGGGACGNWKSLQNSCSFCVCVTERPLAFRGNRGDEMGGGEQRLNLIKHG